MAPTALCGKVQRQLSTVAGSASCRPAAGGALWARRAPSPAVCCVGSPHRYPGAVFARLAQGAAMYKKILSYDTKNKAEFVSITDEVRDCIRESGVDNGTLLLY